MAWLAADDLRQAPEVATSRSLSVVALFGLLVYAPACAYFLTFSPDWSLSYFVDTQKLPSALEMTLLLTDAASAPLGFCAAAPVARARKAGAVMRIAMAPAVLALAMVVATLRRIRVHATYAQYHGDFGTEPLTGSSLGVALLWVGLVVMLGVAWTAWILRSLSSRQEHPS